jgi:hypothetical protein
MHARDGVMSDSIVLVLSFKHSDSIRFLLLQAARAALAEVEVSIARQREVSHVHEKLLVGELPLSLLPGL